MSYYTTGGLAYLGGGVGGAGTNIDQIKDLIPLIVLHSGSGDRYFTEKNASNKLTTRLTTELKKNANNGNPVIIAGSGVWHTNIPDNSLVAISVDYKFSVYDRSIHILDLTTTISIANEILDENFTDNIVLDVDVKYDYSNKHIFFTIPAPPLWIPDNQHTIKGFINLEVSNFE